MSQFGMDKAGSGFDFDDDDADVASMFDKAASASEDSGDDGILGGTGDLDRLISEMEEPRKENRKSSPQKAKVEEEDDDPNFGIVDRGQPVAVAAPAGPEPAPTPEPEPEPEPQPVAVPEPDPEPVAAPEPVAPRPTPATPARPAPSRVKVPSEADQIREASRTIAILDAYRRLSAAEKSVAVQFVTNGEADSVEDAVMVVKVVNCDKLLAETMRSLREAWEKDPVDRAFYAMGLDTNLLHSLGSLVSVFTETNFNPREGNLEYSRSLVAKIDTLSENDISFVKATESVLAAAVVPED